VRHPLSNVITSTSLTTAVWSWASTSCVRSRGQDSRISTLVSSVQDMSSIFHLIISTQDQEQDSDTFSSFVLGFDHPQPTAFTADHLANFINQVKKHPVTTKAESRALLQKYFLASRRIGQDIPQSGMVILIRLSEVHARLSMRQEVVIEDAVFACHFYEECLAGMSGKSQLGVVAKAHIHGASLDEALGRGHDKYMRDFQARLIRFVMEYEEDGNPGSEVKDKEFFHPYQSLEEAVKFSMEGFEEECHSSEDSFDNDNEQSEFQPMLEDYAHDSPTRVEETQDFFSLNVTEDEEQEGVSTQNFKRKLFSEMESDDRQDWDFWEGSKASQQKSKKIALEKSLRADSDILLMKENVGRKTENDIMAVLNGKNENCSNNFRSRRNFIDVLNKFRREPSPDFDQADSQLIPLTQKNLRTKSKHKKEEPRAKDVESVKRDIFADLKSEE